MKRSREASVIDFLVICSHTANSELANFRNLHSSHSSFSFSKLFCIEEKGQGAERKHLAFQKVCLMSSSSRNREIRFIYIFYFSSLLCCLKCVVIFGLFQAKRNQNIFYYMTSAAAAAVEYQILHTERVSEREREKATTTKSAAEGKKIPCYLIFLFKYLHKHNTGCKMLN
jgi:hypothetical protein